MSNDSGKAAQAQPEPPPNSKLNPFAQEFKLNVNAPSFTPVSKPAQPQGSAAPGGRAGPAAGPGPASASSLPPSHHSTGPRPGYTSAQLWTPPPTLRLHITVLRCYCAGSTFHVSSVTL